MRCTTDPGRRAGPGHLFVVHGDLTALSCHDVLVPCSANAHISGWFRSLVGMPLDGGTKVPGAVIPDDFVSSVRTPIPMPGRDGRPRPWLINTASRRQAGSPDVGWLVGGVRTALERIMGDGDPMRSGVRRSRRLVALPAVGLGRGGFGNLRAQVIEHLTAELEAFVGQEGAPDVALVLKERADYDVIQARRPTSGAAHLSPAVWSSVERLSERVRAGEVTFFLGAGVSMAAGLPSWSGLLGELASRAGVTLSSEDVAGLPPQDLASLVHTALSGEPPLVELLRELLRGTGLHALAHALVASMRPPEVITTNYDDLYERAAAVPFEGRLKVLPADRAAVDAPWLLKMHGDLADENNPPVLTRDDYIRFDSDRLPLAAMVQSRLFTRHVVFVGYSLADDNFIRLARQVRTALLAVRRGADASPSDVEAVGTVLTLGPEPARSALWGHDVLHVAVQDEPLGSPERQLEAARRLEIVLDRLACASHDGRSYLMDDRYLELLTTEELDVRKALTSLRGSTGVTPRPGRVARRIGLLLQEFGVPLDPGDWPTQSRGHRPADVG